MTNKQYLRIQKKKHEHDDSTGQSTKVTYDGNKIKCCDVMPRQSMIITGCCDQAIIWSLITCDSVSNEGKRQQNSLT